MKAKTTVPTYPRILLVDDDPVFGRLMMEVARRQGIPFCYLGIRDAYKKVNRLAFDVAVIDFHLGQVTGVQFSNYLKTVKQNVPAILISNLGSIGNSRWPDPIRASCSKKEGPLRILELAIESYQAAKGNQT